VSLPADLPAPFHLLWNYWHSLPRDGFVPDRSQFDPLRLGAALPATVLLEIHDPSRLEVRVLGTAHLLRSGLETTGKNWLDLFDEASHPAIQRSAAVITGYPAGVISRHQEWFGPRQAVEILGLALPLRPPPGRKPMILAVGLPVGGEMPTGETPSTASTGFEIVRILDLGAGVPAEGAAP